MRIFGFLKDLLKISAIIGMSIPASECGLMDMISSTLVSLIRPVLVLTHHKIGDALGLNQRISETELISAPAANMLFRLRNTAAEKVMVVTRGSDGKTWQVWKPFEEANGSGSSSSGGGAFVPLQINLKAINSGFFTTWYPSNDNGMNKVNRIMVADFNGDGRDDLIFRPPGSPQMKILLMDSDGTFMGNVIAVPDPIPENLNRPNDIIFVDYNHDGRDDLLVIERDGTLKYYKNDDNMFSLDLQTGAFEGSIFGQKLNEVHGKILKFDAGKTGKLDLMTIDPKSMSIEIYRSNGRKFDKVYGPISMTEFLDPGTGIENIQNEFSRQNNFFALDLDGDGFDDLLFRDSKGKFTYLYWMGKGTFIKDVVDPKTMYSWKFLGKEMNFRSDALGLNEEGTILCIDSPSDEIGAGILFYSPFTSHFNLYTINGFNILGYETHARNDDFTFDYSKIHPKYFS